MCTRRCPLTARAQKIIALLNSAASLVDFRPDRIVRRQTWCSTLEQHTKDKQTIGGFGQYRPPRKEQISRTQHNLDCE